MLRLAVSAGLLWLLSRQVDWTRALEPLERARVGFLALSMATILAQVPLNGLRLGLFLRARGWWLGAGDLARLTFVTNFLGSFVPAGLGGDVFRATALARTPVPAPVAIASAAADRLTGGVSLALASLLAGLAAWAWKGSPRELALAALPSAGVLAVAAVAWTRPAWRLALGLYQRLPRLPGRGFLRRIHHQVARFGREPALLARVVLVTMGVQALRILSFWLCARALDLPVSLGESALALLPALIFSTMPLSAGGLGVREGLLVWLLPLDATSGLGLALLHRLLTTAANLPGALWFSGRGLELDPRPA